MFINDVLVIGSGIAGCCAALELADSGIGVVLLNKNEDDESNTKYAQGGIAGLGEDDSPVILKKDILDASAGLGYDKAIEVVSNEGPRMLREFLIKRVGVSFTKDKDGALKYTSEAVHSKRRVHYVFDHTGQEIISALIARVRAHPNIDFITEAIVIDLITLGHHSRNPTDVYRKNKCLGAYVFSIKENAVSSVFAKKTILATGGVGNLFLYSSNPPSATGDGLAMAYRAGAAIINAEYIQFHPTTLFHRDANRFLITESLRGEGAVLRNLKGDSFMKSYHKLGDLAPRDVVSRAIYEEIYKTDNGYVLLDARPLLDASIDIEKRFPTIYNKCKQLGINVYEESIPVVPASHYFCGGIKVNLDGLSSIDNLYAIGEVSCTGVHGANRLASISLLEGLVWGLRSAYHIRSSINSIDDISYKSIDSWHSVDTLGAEVDPILIYQDWLSIKTSMWNYAGIVRTRKRLLRAEADLGYLSHRIEKFYKESSLTKDLIELRNGILSANIIVKAALRNKVSIGCHYRKD